MVSRKHLLVFSAPSEPPTPGGSPVLLSSCSIGKGGAQKSTETRNAEHRNPKSGARKPDLAEHGNPIASAGFPQNFPQGAKTTSGCGRPPTFACESCGEVARIFPRQAASEARFAG